MASQLETVGKRRSLPGLKSMAPEEYWKCLENAMRLGKCQIAITRADWNKFVPMPSILSGLVRTGPERSQNREPEDTLNERLASTPPQNRRALLMENKWRAARYGMSGKLIDFGKQTEVPARDLIHEYLDFVDDVVDELGSREELNYIHKMLEEGSGADRQLRVFEETGDLKKVVDYIMEETEAGLEEEEPAEVRKVG